MRTLILILLFASTSVLGQVKNKSVSDKTNIDIQTVDYIEIRNHSGKVDTVPTIRKRLTTEQIKVFADKWNSAKLKGPYKSIVRFWFDVHFKDGSERTFKVSGQIIKEKNDWGIDSGDKNYADKLWTEIK